MEKDRNGMRAVYVATMGLLAAILLLGQVVMAPLPNIEPVTFLIIIYTLVYGKKVFYIIYTFALLEGIIYGFGIWWISYLYVWPLLAGLVLLMRKNESVVIWAVLAGAFGLCFGALCALPYALFGGIAAGVAYWIEGIPFDLTHCAGNAVITLVLFKPVYHIILKLDAAAQVAIDNKEKTIYNK